VASVNILFSNQIDQFYIGSCLDLATRLEFHQNKVYKNAFTRRANDWELYFEIPDLYFEAARKIETHIKNMKSRVYLQNLTNYPEISLKLTLKFGASSSR
jgi:putative endonuclease